MVDLASQISSRARRADATVALMPEAVRERALARLRAAFDADDDHAHALQKDLRLEGSWNVSPEDIRVSERRGVGLVLSGVRSAFRPLLKLVANVDLPLYKQFKINLGIAETLHELLCRNAELQGRVEDLSRRVEELESERIAQPGGGDQGRG